MTHRVSSSAFVSQLTGSPSIMYLWCAFNAVCCSGHQPEKALGEQVCVCARVYAYKCVRHAALLDGN